MVREDEQLVLRALETLSEKERAALVLRDLEGLSTQEVADILGSIAHHRALADQHRPGQAAGVSRSPPAPRAPAASDGRAAVSCAGSNEAALALLRRRRSARARRRRALRGAPRAAAPAAERRWRSYRRHDRLAARPAVAARMAALDRPLLDELQRRIARAGAGRRQAPWLLAWWGRLFAGPPPAAGRGRRRPGRTAGAGGGRRRRCWSWAWWARWRAAGSLRRHRVASPACRPSGRRRGGAGRPRAAHRDADGRSRRAHHLVRRPPRQDRR